MLKLHLKYIFFFSLYFFVSTHKEYFLIFRVHERVQYGRFLANMDLNFINHFLSLLAVFES
jgi:hypothetical protein